jgi:hypothetical protein
MLKVPDLDDFDLPEDREAPESTLQKRSKWPWILLLLLVIGGAGAGWFFYSQRRGPPPAAEAEGVPDAGVPEAKSVDLNMGPAALEAYLRKGAAELNPTLAEWLKEADLIRRLAAAVNLVAAGESPSPVLAFLGPKAPFKVEEVWKKAPPPKKSAKKKGKRSKKVLPPSMPEEIYIDPASYARYDGVATVVGSLDAAALGAALPEVLPYFDAAYAVIGRPGTSFSGALKQAVQRLTAVQLPVGKVALKAQGPLYHFADPALEQLSPAEKHLLRMGPKNAAVIQAALKTFHDAFEAVP